MIWLLLTTTWASEPKLHSSTSAHTLSNSNAHFVAGVFRPWSWSLSDRTDLTTTGLIGSFLSPGATVKVRVSDWEDGALSVVGGAYTPTPILKLSKGWLYGDEDRLPLALSTKVAVLATKDLGRMSLTGGLMLRVGGAFGENDYTDRDFYFLDWALAPVVHGVVGQAQLQADLRPSDRVLLTVDLRFQVGEGLGMESQSRWFVLWGLSRHVALGGGVFSHVDQRANGVKSYLLPAADFQVRF